MFGVAETVRESPHHAGLGGGGEALAAIAQRRKDRHRAAGRPLQIDFVARIALDTEQKGRAGDLFEAGVLDPKLVGLAGFERDGRRHTQKMGRVSVSPASRSRMAASRCPSKEESITVSCQPGEGLHEIP